MGHRKVRRGHLSDPRREKRVMRGMRRPIDVAYNGGLNAAVYGWMMPPRLRSNPYPPGRRHDEWERGFAEADPMGEHHGRNE